MPIEKVIGDLENPQRKESLRPLQLTPQEKKVSSDLVLPPDLQELKEIHFKHTGKQLSEPELIELSTRLLNLFRVIGKSY